MIKIFTTIAFQFWTIFLFGQAQIKCDTASFDYGQIVEGAEVKKEFHFTNIGTEPLIIQRATTGDGGSKAHFPKEPILPGKSGIITFYYDTHRIGKFERCISVSSNAKEWTGGCDLKVKGEVIWHPTTIQLDSVEKNIGNLNFGDVDTIQFTITNTGENNLHINFNKTAYSESDLLKCEIQSKDNIDKEYKNNYGGISYGPNEIILVTALIKNVYGNTGQFERNLFIGFNSHDTLFLKIKGRFVGTPGKKIIYDRSKVYYYEKDKLVKRQDFFENGKLRKEYFYDGSYCIHSIEYHWYLKAVTEECFYNNGKLSDTRTYKVDDN